MKKPYGAELFRMRRIAERRNDKLHGAEVWGAFDLLLTMLAVVVFALAIRAVLVEPVRVEGESMLDTLQNGDYLFVEKLTYAVNEPKIGDIVICYYPDSYYQFRNKDYRSRVKRVVAVAGDTVETKNGALYVNGEMVDEPYLSENRRETTGVETAITIAGGEVYVLGDNRSNSNDSRNALVGPIPLERIVGKAHFILFPFDHLRGVTSWR